MEIEVTQGAILINSIHLVIDRPDFKVIMGDLRSKYVDNVMEQRRGDSLGVSLWAGPQTLHTLPTTRPTDVNFAMSDGRAWDIVAQASRYTFTIVLWRLPQETLDHPFPPVMWRRTGGDPEKMIYKREEMSA